MDEDKDNIKHIYAMIAGPMGVENYTGTYEGGGQRSVEIDLSTFSDPSTKTLTTLQPTPLTLGNQAGVMSGEPMVRS